MPTFAVGPAADGDVADYLIQTAHGQIDMLSRGEVAGDMGFQLSTTPALPMCLIAHRHHAPYTSGETNTLAQPIVMQTQCPRGGAPVLQAHYFNSGCTRDARGALSLPGLHDRIQFGSPPGYVGGRRHRNKGSRAVGAKGGGVTRRAGHRYRARVHPACAHDHPGPWQKNLDVRTVAVSPSADARKFRERPGTVVVIGPKKSLGITCAATALSAPHATRKTARTVPTHSTCELGC